MKITDKENTRLPLHQMKVGDIFRHPDTGNLFMKTNQMFDEKGNLVNAIHLESGILLGLDKYGKVIPVDCELVIK